MNLQPCGRAGRFSRSCVWFGGARGNLSVAFIVRRGEYDHRRGDDVGPRCARSGPRIRCARNHFAASVSRCRGQTDASGFFSMNLAPGVRNGQTVSVTVEHAEYKPDSMQVRVTGAPLLLWLTPARPKTPQACRQERQSSAMCESATPSRKPRTSTSARIAKTFEAVNTGGKPCQPEKPCSPTALVGRRQAG